MAGIGLRLNGRKITSSSQLKRELIKSIEKQIDEKLRKAAGPNVSVKKTQSGYIFEGSAASINNLAKRIK